MPVRFLSDEQVQAYSEFEELPSLSDLEKFFFLDAFDRNVIARSRQDAHRLGVALQIRPRGTSVQRLALRTIMVRA